MSGFWEWNLSFLTVLAAHRSNLLTYFMGAVTWLGSEYILIGVVCLLYLCLDKKLAYKLGLSFFISAAAVQILKLAFRIERPWVLIEKYPHLQDKYSAVEQMGVKAGATGYSFPSGHTQSAVALYGALGLHFRKVWLKIVMFVIMVLVAFSRLYLGVHTPLDVGVSFLLTFAVVGLGSMMFDKLYENPKSDWPLAIATAVISVAAIIFGMVIYKLHGDTVDRVMAADCLKMASCGVGFAIGYILERRVIRFDPTVGKVWQKALRLVLGVGGVFAIKEGVKYLGKVILGQDSLIVDMLRYFLMILFAFCLVPVITKAIHKNNRKSV